MADDIAKSLAASRRGLVVAPAGCGKTHLIAQAVGLGSGRQLILTHTHAGVRAILNLLQRLEVQSSLYRVSTIDGFALRYAAGFPSLSGWTNPEPSGDDWKLLPPAALRAFSRRAVRRVLTASYDGVYVDEYQDCSGGQHSLVTAIADVLPCRILGDPMQAIFPGLNPSDSIPWADVLAGFPLLGDLDTPWRWAGKNEGLGRWLQGVRRSLLAGDPIDLGAGPVNWQRDISSRSQIGACFQSLRSRDQSVVALRGWPQECQSLAKNLRNTFSAMESVECPDLLSWANQFEKKIGLPRLKLVVKFVRATTSRATTIINDLSAKIASGKMPRLRTHDRAELLKAMLAVVQDNALLNIDRMLAAVEKLDGGVTIGRRELWREMRKILQHYVPSTTCPLSKAAWKLRDIGRRVGRRVAHRCVATTLLVKGLEFDRSLVLNVDDHQDAENLYVAITRGSRALTILSSGSTVQRPRPQFLL